MKRYLILTFALISFLNPIVSEGTARHFHFKFSASWTNVNTGAPINWNSHCEGFIRSDGLFFWNVPKSGLACCSHAFRIVVDGTVISWGADLGASYGQTVGTSTGSMYYGQTATLQGRHGIGDTYSWKDLGTFVLTAAHPWEDDDDDECDDEDFPGDSHECCDQDCDSCGAGDVSVSLDSLSIRVGLGQNADGSSAGNLLIHRETPDPDILSLAGVDVTAGPDTTVTTSGNTMTVEAPLLTAFVEEIPEDANLQEGPRLHIDLSYSMDHHSPHLQGETFRRVELFREFESSANQTVMHDYRLIDEDNPAAGFNLVDEKFISWEEVLEMDGEDVVVEGGTWTLGDGHLGLWMLPVRNETLRTVDTASGDARTTTRIVSYQDGHMEEERIDLKEVTEWTEYSWGLEKVEERTYTSENEYLAKTWDYYDDPSDGGNHGRLRLFRDEDSGYWRHHSYDSQGRVVKIVEPYLESEPIFDPQDPSAVINEEVHRVTLKQYSLQSLQDPTGNVLDRVIDTSVYEKDTIVSKRRDITWAIFFSIDEQVFRDHSTIRFHSPSAAWDDDQNLVTRATRYVGGPWDGETARIINEDATAILYDYEFAGGGKVTTIRRGVLANGTNTFSRDSFRIVEGEKSVIKTNAFGEVVFEERSTLQQGGGGSEEVVTYLENSLFEIPPIPGDPPDVAFPHIIWGPFNTVVAERDDETATWTATFRAGWELLSWSESVQQYQARGIVEVTDIDPGNSWWIWIEGPSSTGHVTFNSLGINRSVQMGASPENFEMRAKPNFSSWSTWHPVGSVEVIAQGDWGTEGDPGSGGGPGPEADWDGHGRPRLTVYLDGTSEERDFACCGQLTWVRDREGAETNRTFDPMGHLESETRAGITREFIHDSLGRRLSENRYDGSSGHFVSSASYDWAGRITSRTLPFGEGETRSDSYDYDVGEVHIGYADGGERIERTHADGRRKEIVGSAVSPVRYEYGVDPLKGSFTTEIRLDDSGLPTTETVTTYRNFLGQNYLVEYAGGASEEISYNKKGRLQWTRDPDGVVTYFTYNALGERKETAILITGDETDPNNPIDFAGKDRIVRTTREYTTRDSTHVRRETTYAWFEEDLDQPTQVALIDRSLDGRQIWTERDGAVTHSATEFHTDPGATLDPGERRVTTTLPDESAITELYRDGRLSERKHKSESGALLTGATFEYDSFGRLEKEIRQPGGEETLYTYWDDDQLRSITTPDPDSSKTGPGWEPQTTEWEYFLQPEGVPGRKTITRFPDGKERVEILSPRGLLEKTYGDGSYPVGYEYDPQGRVRTMTTWQEFDSATGTGSQSATTEWNYHPQRGWLESKLYDGEPGPAFTYDYWPSGRLKERNTRGGVKTTYAYTVAGNLETIVYDDDTPAVEIKYSRRGQRRQVTQTGSGGVATRREFAYNTAGLLRAETWTAGPLDGFEVEFQYDALHRFERLRLKKDAVTVVDHNYGYKPGSSFLDYAEDLTQQTIPIRADFTYNPGSPFLAGTELSRNGSPVLAIDRQRDAIYRLNAIGSPVASFAYDFDNRNRRVRAEREDGEHWKYGHDTLGQLTSASRHLANDQPKIGHDFEFEYDTIGNRLWSTRNFATTTYTPNLLNQYEERDVPGVIQILGTANPDATVTVNQQPVLRQEAEFARNLPVDNAGVDVYENIRIVGVKTVDDPEPVNYVSETERDVFVPKTPEVFIHDDDGNLTQDGRWTYEWNGENRLIAMETRDDLSSALPRQRLEFTYDADGRRIRKEVYEWDLGTSTFVLAKAIRFLYAGWNLLAEVTTTDDLIRSYLWGVGESGRLEFTATPGALLGLRDHVTDAFYFAQADGNGNIVALVDSSDATLAARYEYGPFGEPLLAVGAMAEANPLRFSSTYVDTETGLLYYGYRLYCPELGRWISRDPIEEQGGANLYGMVGNNPVNFWDLLGLLGLSADQCLQLKGLLESGNEAELERRLKALGTIPDELIPDIILIGQKGGPIGEAILGRTLYGEPFPIIHDPSLKDKAVTVMDKEMRVNLDAPLLIAGLADPFWNMPDDTTDEQRRRMNNTAWHRATVLVHEFGHAYVGLKDPFNDDVFRNPVVRNFQNHGIMEIEASHYRGWSLIPSPGAKTHGVFDGRLGSHFGATSIPVDQWWDLRLESIQSVRDFLKKWGCCHED